MPTLTITKGLPASGKSTWAKEQVLKSKGLTKRVSKDVLREMLVASEWSRQREKFVVAIERRIVRYLLEEEFDVIVDNTHLGGDHEEYYRNFAQDCGYFFDIKDFTDVPLQTCIDRDSARGDKSVGKKVIKTMYNSFIKGKGHVAQYESPAYNPDLPFCIIVDIDGTLAHGTGRNMYDYTQVHTDAADVVIGDMVRKYAQGSVMDEMPDNYIVIVSGRENSSQQLTEEWLKDNKIPYHEIYMRQAGDMRSDTIVKKEIYEEWIKNRYNVRFVLDDRNKVVKMWREEGLKVLQVQEGDF